MRKFISTFIVLWTIWLLLAGFEVSEVVVGGIAALVLAAVISNVVEYSFDLYFPVKLVKFVVIYIPVFIYQLVLANIDIAYRVLSPSLPINPGFVKISTDIKSSMGRLILANSITLTPGTVSLDVDDEFIYIHLVNVQGSDNREYQRNISGAFEKVLGGIFK